MEEPRHVGNRPAKVGFPSELILPGELAIEFADSRQGVLAQTYLADLLKHA